MAGQYIVSALKYRPQRFDTVIGQSHITQTLKNALKTGHLAHSFLFCGPRGVGKTTCARILAKTINCLNPTADNEACDTCENCQSFKNNTSFNIFELDAASNNSVDDIRELTEQVRFAPAGNSKYKVYIIDEVHMLSSNAFNAFLKTLEEPPSYAIFILATTEKHKILPTILSRCQIFEFKRIVTKDTVQHLKQICEQENISAEEDALHFIASKSEGCMRDALSIMDKIASFSGGAITYKSTIENLNILDYDYFFKIIEAIATEDMSSALLMYDDILAKGFEGDMFLAGMAEHCRNLLMCKDAQIAQLMDVADGIKKKYFEQGASVSKNLLLNAINLFNQADIDYRTARNKRLHVEILLIKLCNISSAVKVLSDAQGNFVQKKLSNNRIIPIRTIKAIAPTLQIQQTKPSVDSVVNEPAISFGQTVARTPALQATTPNANAAPRPMPQTPAASENPYGLSLSKNSFLEQAKQKMAAQQELSKVEITADNIVTTWHEYVDLELGTQEFFSVALKRCNIAFIGEDVTLEAIDAVSSEYLGPNKIKIAKFLKEKYLNPNITLAITRAENIETPVYIQSQREIFEEYVLEHPLLKEFKDRLSLDLEAF